MDIPASLAAQSAMTRQVVALSVLRQSAGAAQQVADMIAETVSNAPVSGNRGAHVNLTV